MKFRKESDRSDIIIVIHDIVTSGVYYIMIWKVYVMSRMLLITVPTFNFVFFLAYILLKCSRGK